VTLVGAIPALAQSEAPSAEFISAALQAQEEAGAGKLAVSYVRSEEGGSSADRPFTFVRTPGVLCLSYGEDNHYRAAHQRQGGEQRVLYARDAGDVGIESSGSAHAWNQDSLDPAHWALEDRSLAEAIAAAPTPPVAERVSGIDCWRVEVAPIDPSYNEITVWLDPEVGFMPRRMEILRPGLTAVRVFEEYEEVAPGQWFPWVSTVALELSPHPDLDPLSLDYRYVVDEVLVGEEVEEDDLWFEFPMSAEVHTG
jgi:hypothetical protein